MMSLGIRKCLIDVCNRFSWPPRVLLSLSASAAILSCGCGATPRSIQRIDPRIDAIIPAGATLEKVAGGFQFTEGPVWHRSGTLFFTDITAATINQLTPDGKIRRYFGPQELTERNLAIAGLPGANGLTLDREGRLTICDQAHRVVSRLETNNAITVLADRFEGHRLNSPNDLVYKSDGSLYFTDPPYGLEKEDQDKNKEAKINGVYRISDGTIRLLLSDLPRPNGLAFSPDEKFLYVNNSEPRKVIMRYAVNADGSLGPGSLFADLSASSEPGLPDGLKVDQRGNLYSAGPGGIWIFSPDGKHLGTIRVPEIAANCAWGAADARTLYITATTSIYRITLNVPGIRP